MPKSGPGEWFIKTTKDPEKYGYVNQGGLSRKVCGFDHDDIRNINWTCLIQHIFAAIKESLQRLQLDYVDVLQCMLSFSVTD